MKYTRQEIVDRVAKHFLVDKMSPAVIMVDVDHGTSTRCIYGEPTDKVRCAIGIFDVDGVLTKHVATIEQLPSEDVKMVFGSYKKEDLGFLSMVQQVHDGAFLWDAGGANSEQKIVYNEAKFLDGVKRRLSHVCWQYGLKNP